jgi:transposase InsO family protein
MTKDDVLFGYRLQVFDLAGRTSVSHACRVFGIHRSTYYGWKAQVDRGGLEMLRPKERRRPQMPNQLSAVVEERIVSFAIAHPGLGPKPPREPQPEPHIEVARPGELVGIDCFKIGKLRGTQGEVWQLTAIDVHSSYGWAELVACPSGNPTAAQTSKLAKRIAAELSAAGWRLERVLSDNGNEFKASFHELVTDTLKARHSYIRSGRPQTNGHVERLHRTILEECWRPAFARTSTSASPDCGATSTTTSTPTTTTASTTAASHTAAYPQTSSTVPKRWNPDDPHLSAHLRVRAD